MNKELCDKAIKLLETVWKVVDIDYHTDDIETNIWFREREELLKKLSKMSD